MDIDPTQLYQQAAAWTRDHVERVSDGQAGDTTPCADWPVAKLIEHLIGEQHMFATALRDGQPVGTAAEQRSDAAPVEVYDSGVQAVVAAARAPGAMEQVVTLPIGQVPGSVAVLIAFTDTLVHGWDLATATGQDATMPDELAAAALGIYRQSDMAGLRESGLFGPEQPSPDGAGHQAKLLAFTGRQP